MYINMRNKYQVTALLLLVVALLSFGLFHGSAQAATLPATTCTGTGTVTCDLWALTGSITLSGSPITIWGYSATDPGSGGVAGLPGPALIVNQGDVVTVNLTNYLPEATALIFQGQSMIPDLIGAPAYDSGTSTPGTKSYTFTASNPGTFLYEAGLLQNAQHQVAMGLYGALIVRPAAAGQAYADASTAYDDEALVVLSEIDPVLNGSVDPALFDLRDYAPTYFLINGKISPNTDPIATLAGNKVLLRYVNAGLQAHSMSVLGLNQTAIAMDGSPFLYAHGMVAETISTGQTADAIITIPAGTTDGSKFALYDGSFYLHNNNTNGVGGMLTFLTVGTAVVGPDTTGPQTTAVLLTPSVTDGSIDVAVSASVSDVNTGNANIQAAEFYIDSTSGTSNPMSASDAAFDSPTEAVQGTISVATMAGLSAGNHTIYIRGQDALGNWGQFNPVVLNLDKVGPAISALLLTPNPANGTVDVALSATANDNATGGSNIAAAEYTIDGGAAVPMTVNAPAPIASLTATIQSATVNALSTGLHTISVRSQDAIGNWGTPSTIDLLVDKTGPTTSSLSASPNPNNGTQPYNSSTPAVRVTGTFTDAASNIVAAEGFIDTLGANGTGFVFVAQDGAFNSLVEVGTSDIPLATVNALPEGGHRIYVHAKDAAGNWGPNTIVYLFIDKTKPTVSGVSASPNPTNSTTAPFTNNTSFVLNATASDVGTGNSRIIRAEWFVGTDPGVGNGTPMSAVDGSFNSATEAVTATINFMSLGWAPGDYTVYVRAQDRAYYWSDPVPTVVTVVWPDSIFADGFESGNTLAWNATTGPNVSVSAAAAMAGSTQGMQVGLSGTTQGFVTNTSPTAERSYHARFYFDPNSALPNNNNAPNGVNIFAGLNPAGARIIQVQFRRQTSGQYQLRMGIVRNGGTTFTSWINITDAPHSIEIAWQSATSATASITIDGTVAGTLSGLNTSAQTLETVRLGPSDNLVAGASGTLYFDAFVSTRWSVIGP
jgi:FtsP/CotA-like multicopper oxidase with cupredoxin domain